jgi:UDP-N-acetylglucosamine 1-carboxyvinyltransferase
MRKRPGPLSVRTEPYPGFPTDLHPQLAAYLATCEGESRITETVFKERFRYLEGLSAFGAAIARQGDAVSIVGRTSLSGARATAPDLRAAAAYLTAAMAAEGESLLFGAELLYRGYEAPLRKLRRLGAIISDGVDARA